MCDTHGVSRYDICPSWTILLLNSFEFDLTEDRLLEDVNQAAQG